MNQKLIGLFIILNLVVVSLMGVVMVSVPNDGADKDRMVLPMMTFAATGIADVNQLQNMSLNLSGDYYLTQSIDCSTTSGWNGGYGFDPVGDNTDPFNGTFDGKGYKLVDLNVIRPWTNEAVR